jgi:hypothetical protein
MARYEALAEEAWSAMYEAAPYSVKDYYDDARLYLNKAIALASGADLERLTARSQHFVAVYNSQFRYVRR